MRKERWIASSLALLAMTASLADSQQDRPHVTQTLRTRRRRRRPRRSARSAGGRGWRWRIRGWRRKRYRGVSPKRTRSRRTSPKRCRCCSTAKPSVVDSWAIANYLEDSYPDRPSLFGGEGGRAMARMLNWWGDLSIVGGIFPLIIADIPLNLKPVDAAYFRKTREARFGKPLEEIMSGRDKAVEGFRKIARSVAADAEDATLLSAATRRTTPTLSYLGRSSGRAWSHRSSCWPKTIRSTPGASGCSMRSTAWRGNRRAIRPDAQRSLCRTSG